MALSKEVSEYFNLVCELDHKRNVIEADNTLAKEVISINNAYKNATSNINKACHYLNESTSDIIKERTCSSAISVGKESAPQIVALKQLSDKVFASDVKGCDLNIEEKLVKTLSKVEDNLYRMEDFRKSTNKSIQNLEYLIRKMKKQCPQERNSSTVSEISSFLDKDVVTSSPISTK